MSNSRRKMPIYSVDGSIPDHDSMNKLLTRIMGHRLDARRSIRVMTALLANPRIPLSNTSLLVKLGLGLPEGVAISFALFFAG